MSEDREQVLAARKRQAGGGPWIPSVEEMLTALQMRAQLVRGFYRALQTEGFQPHEALELTGRLFPD